MFDLMLRGTVFTEAEIDQVVLLVKRALLFQGFNNQSTLPGKEHLHLGRQFEGLSCLHLVGEQRGWQPADTRLDKAPFLKARR